MTLIKFEKEIDECMACPFHDTLEKGSECSRIGIWYVSKCQYIGEIKEHDYDKMREDDDYCFTVPDNCPFKK